MDKSLACLRLRLLNIEIRAFIAHLFALHGAGVLVKISNGRSQLIRAAIHLGQLETMSLNSSSKVSKFTLNTSQFRAGCTSSFSCCGRGCALASQSLTLNFGFASQIS